MRRPGIAGGAREMPQMTDTNDRPGNEAWLFEIVLRMEEDGHLGAFCGHIGMPVSPRGVHAAEVLWPVFKTHYTVADGTLDVARACRDLLEFPPTMEIVSRATGASRKD